MLGEKLLAKKPKKPNDGGHSPFGVNIDPSKDLVHNTNEDGSCEAYYKGSKIKYDDYIGELQTRVHRNKQGKGYDSNSMGVFGGVRFDKNGKIIKN